MRHIFTSFVLINIVISLSAQPSQITVIVESEGQLLDDVTVDIRTSSFRLKGMTGIDGEFSTSTNFSDKIKPGEDITIICFKKGYEPINWSGRIGFDYKGRVFDIKLKPHSDPKIFILGEVIDRTNGMNLEGVNILLLTKKRRNTILTGFFGEFLIELLPDELLSRDKVSIQLKKEGYADKQVSLNLSTSESQKVYLNRLPEIKKKKVINYIPVAGNFFRNENLSGWIYSIGLISSAGIISYSSIQIPILEEKALKAVSNAGRENYLNKMEFHQNLRKGTTIFSSILLGTSLVHCIVNSNKINSKGQDYSYVNERFKVEFGSGGIGITLVF